MSKTIDDEIEHLLKEESAQTKAVISLIDVKERTIGKLGTEIELKTDLDESQVCVHTAVDMISTILEMDTKKFNNECILGNLTNLKERKLLSKNRMSRKEIVDVAKNPELKFMDEPSKRSGFVSNLFRSRRENI